MKLREAFLLLVFASPALQVFSQNTSVGQPGELVGQQRAITTAVPFIGITPDARHAALGDAGVATSADASDAWTTVRDDGTIVIDYVRSVMVWKRAHAPQALLQWIARYHAWERA